MLISNKIKKKSVVSRQTVSVCKRCMREDENECNCIFTRMEPEPHRVDIDTDIIEAVRVFNLKGWRTYLSCSGHHEENTDMYDYGMYLVFRKDEYPPIRMIDEHPYLKAIKSSNAIYVNLPSHWRVMVRDDGREVHAELWQYVLKAREELYELALELPINKNTYWESDQAREDVERAREEYGKTHTLWR